jgi:hypothetical protein
MILNLPALKIVFKVDRRALMGSVSTYIVNHAACPVTVVKENM